MLTPAEVDVFRSPQDYVTWFDELLHRVSLNPTQKRDTLTHVGPFKVIYEELFPLASLLRAKSSAWGNSEFKSVLGNQPYDVEIRNHPLRYLEIVSTVYDDAERFRMLRFIEKKSVDAIGRIERDDAGRPARIEREGEMRLHSEVIGERLVRVRSAIEKKAAKSYPAHVGLVVYFDDASSEISAEDSRLFERVILTTRTLWVPVFQSVFLIGPRGERCIEAHTA